MSIAVRFLGERCRVALVEDDQGARDCTWTADTGWSCSCGEEASCCAHVSAVRMAVLEAQQ